MGVEAYGQHTTDSRSLTYTRQVVHQLSSCFGASRVGGQLVVPRVHASQHSSTSTQGGSTRANAQFSQPVPNCDQRKAIA
jgi:hypothetical protein